MVNNRAGKEVREKCDKEGVVNKVIFSGKAPIGINEKRYLGKCKKTYSKRKNNKAYTLKPCLYVIKIITERTPLMPNHIKPRGMDLSRYDGLILSP